MYRFLLFSISLALTAPGCGAPAQAPPCPDSGTTLTYENFGRRFLDLQCSWCHAAAAADRHGAPPEFTFDTLDQVITHRDRIYARATGDRPSMPPGPDKPPAEERRMLAEWLSCAPP